MATSYYFREMTQAIRYNDSVHWFMNELTSRIIVESGIPTDRFHLGKIILRSLKDNPDFVVQIDGATGEEENSKSVLKRSVRCAIGFKNIGLRTGDVMVLMAPNHIHLAIPYYAALYQGVIIAPVDKNLGVNELQGTFSNIKPKIVFCQSEKAPDVQLAVNNLGLDSKIVTFDKGDYLCSFPEFLERHGDDTPAEEFKTEDFDPEDTIGFLIPTSGTTGSPKSVAVTQKNLAITGPYFWSGFFNFPTPTRLALISSPLQWLSAIYSFVMSPILRYPRLQTSEFFTQEVAYNLINTYKPTFILQSPTMMQTLMNPDDRDQCDFTCFELIMLGGSAVPQDLIDEIKNITPKAEVVNVYGMSEVAGIIFQMDNQSPRSCGKPIGCFQYRIIDVDTQQDIVEPNVPGELWIKGPSVFKEYYNNPEATEETFAEDRWFKTGDTFYMDDNWNFYFVDRIKLLLKYKNNHVSPVELETVIRQHPGVLDVAVTGIPDPECGELPVACVVARQGSNVTAEEIKQLVKESLSDSKQLRGGVIFIDNIPMTASTKVHRQKLRELALIMEKE